MVFSNKSLVHRLSLILSIKIILLLAFLIPNYAWGDRFGNESKTLSNIIQCFSCYMKRSSAIGRGNKKRDWVREKFQSMLLADDIKEKRPRMDNKYVYTRANSTYTLVVEGNVQTSTNVNMILTVIDPNIDSVVDH